MQLDDSVWLLGAQVVLIKVHELFDKHHYFQFDLLFSSFFVYQLPCMVLFVKHYYCSHLDFLLLFCYFKFRCSRNLVSVIVVWALVLHETQAPSKYMRVFMDISAFAHSNFFT
ncbi:hypothetical protein VPH35_088948 [Triticum aestivum]